jgi:hypothetical protein
MILLAVKRDASIIPVFIFGSLLKKQQRQWRNDVEPNAHVD